MLIIQKETPFAKISAGKLHPKVERQQHPNPRTPKEPTLIYLVKLARDLTRPIFLQMVVIVREVPGYFREIVRLVKYYSIWPDICKIFTDP